jgi:hypothetical protein
MGDFNSYVFFAIAAGLTAAAVVIAIVSVVSHFREAGLSPLTSPPVLGEPVLGESDAGAE